MKWLPVKPAVLFIRLAVLTSAIVLLFCLVDPSSWIQASYSLRFHRSSLAANVHYQEFSGTTLRTLWSGSNISSKQEELFAGSKSAWESTRRNLQRASQQGRYYCYDRRHDTTWLETFRAKLMAALGLEYVLAQCANQGTDTWNCTPLNTPDCQGFEPSLCGEYIPNETCANVATCGCAYANNNLCE